MNAVLRWLSRWARHAGLAVILGTGLIPVWAQAAAASSPQLNVTGSSFAGVAISQWQGQFNELYGGNINFTVSSSVIGMNEFCGQTIDFGATDIAYSTQQSNCSTSQVPYPFQYMPDVAGGLAFEYNLNGQNGQQITSLVLNAPTLVGIFTGQISNWDDSAIQSLNPQIRLPDQQITPYYRSDPSGENYLLSDYFLHTDSGPITDFQRVASVPSGAGQPSATWASFSNGLPSSSEFPNLGGLVGVSGSDAASQGPVHTAGGISYVETAYAKNVGLPVASVVNQAGYAAQPTSYNVATALTKAILYSDLTQNLGDVYTNPDPDTYPISAYSYFVAQCVPSQAAAQNFSCDSSGSVTMSSTAGAELSNFIAFVACQGQSRMAELGYSPLPPNLVEDDFQAAGRLPGGTTPPAPTASNCANPYITGQLQPLGEPQTVNQANPGTSDVGTGSSSSSSSSSAGSSSAGSGSSGSSSSSSSSASSSPAGSSPAGSSSATPSNSSSPSPAAAPAAVASSPSEGSSPAVTSPAAAGAASPAAAAATSGAAAAASSAPVVPTPGGPPPPAPANGAGAGGAASSTQVTVAPAVAALAGPGSYNRSAALAAVASLGLRGWPVGRDAFWCVLFAMVVLGFPLLGFVQKRRRRPSVSRDGMDDR